MVGANGDEGIVGTDVIDPVGDGLADGVAREVVDIDEFRSAVGLPLTPCILEVADQLLLLGVDGDERDAARKAVRRLGVDVLELGVAVGVLAPFDRLTRRLQAVAELSEQARNCLVADADPVLREHLGRQFVRALARPSQRGLRVSTGSRIDEDSERGDQLRMHDLMTSPAATNAPRSRQVCPRRHTRPNLVPAKGHRADRQTGRSRDCRDSSATQCLCFGTGP